MQKCLELIIKVQKLSKDYLGNKLPSNLKYSVILNREDQKFKYTVSQFHTVVNSLTKFQLECITVAPFLVLLFYVMRDFNLTRASTFLSVMMHSINLQERKYEPKASAFGYEVHPCFSTVVSYFYICYSAFIPRPSIFRNIICIFFKWSIK